MSFLDILKGKRKKQKESEKASRIQREGDLEKSPTLRRLAKEKARKAREKKEYEEHNKRVKGK